MSYFDGVAQEWDAMRSEFFSESVRDRALAAAGVQAGQVAADIGAGSGFVTEALLNAGLRVIAVDPSAAMLDVIRRKFDGVICRQSTSESLPLETSSVDFAFANMVLHHVEQPLLAISEMARILRPGGRLVITDLDTHQFEFLREEHHDRWMGFARAEVQQWFEQAGLSRVEVGDVGCNCCAGSSCGTQRAEVSIFVAQGTK
jgi:ubiquinone/menaquinone biosynthesis C-methylase UbiE